MYAVNWPRVVLLLGLVSRLCVGAEAASLYTIGNSLTNDMVPEGVAALAVDSGVPTTVGFHIRATSSLTYIVANPGDVTFTLGGAWDSALRTTAWDHVTMQPYRGTGSTLASEKAAMKTLIDLANRIVRTGPLLRLCGLAQPGRHGRELRRILAPAGIHAGLAADDTGESLLRRTAPATGAGVSVCRRCSGRSP